MPNPLVERHNRVEEVLPWIPDTVLPQEFKFLEQAKAGRIQVQVFIGSGRPAQQDTVHESLHPREDLRFSADSMHVAAPIPTTWVVGACALAITGIVPMLRGCDALFKLLHFAGRSEARSSND